MQVPHPAEPWEGICDALKEGDMAPQTGVFHFTSYAGNEDCLFINVFTPKVTGHIHWENDLHALQNATESHSAEHATHTG